MKGRKFVKIIRHSDVGRGGHKGGDGTSAERTSKHWTGPGGELLWPFTGEPRKPDAPDAVDMDPGMQAANLYVV